MRFLCVPLILLMLLCSSQISVSADLYDSSEEELIAVRAENRKVKRKQASTFIASPADLNRPIIRKRKKGSMILALDADDNGNPGMFIKANRTKKSNKAEFLGPFFFAPEGLLDDEPGGATSLKLEDEEGKEVKLVAKEGSIIIRVDGVESSLQGPRGLTGAPGAAGAVGPAGPAGPAGSGAFSTTANISSNSPGALATDDFVFGSDSLLDDGDASHDARMLFDKSRGGAFRAGVATGTQWNTLGFSSGSFGTDNTVTGQNSFANGQFNNASGSHSIASGSNNTASNFASFAFGQSNNVSSSSSFAAGSSNQVTSSESIAMGLNSRANNASTIALGRFVRASGSRSIAIGEGAGSNRMDVTTGSSLGIGFNSTIPTLHVGPGTGAGTIGRVGIGTITPGSTLEVDGGIRGDLLTLDPCGAADFPEGTLFYNNTSDYYCFCNGAGDDVQMHSPATACF